MFNFPESSVSQAVRAQLNAQLSFFTQFSDKVLEGVQRMNELNSQMARTMWEESLANAQQLLSPTDQSNKASLLSQGQPTAEKIRAYQQHVQNIVAETQAGIAKVVETHVPETARAAEAVVREVAQKASEDTVKATQRQKEAFEKIVPPPGQTPERPQAGASKPVH